MGVDGQTEAVERFIEDMGLMTQSDGAPRIAGRIFGLMIAEGRAFSLQEMAERLRVSRASISTNARQLATHGLLRLTSRPGERQDYYELAPDPYRHMMRTMSDNMRHKAKVVAEAAERFGRDNAARARVAQLAEFYAVSAEVMADWSERVPSTQVD